MPALAFHSFSKAIEIPISLRDQPLKAWQTSGRLNTLLNRFDIHVLGDLHGRKVADFALEKNCGSKTLYELDMLARRARRLNGSAPCVRLYRRSVDSSQLPSRSFSATDSESRTRNMQHHAVDFVVPDSIGHLRFDELPMTTRLANVVHSMGARILGDLNGRDAFELLQYKDCGWGTISEVQQLIERAVSGEFNADRIEQATAPAELLRLLEQGLEKLPVRDRQFVLARVNGETRTARSPHAPLLCTSYAEIGRQYGLTRACIHKVVLNALDNLRRIWGPRVPRLLDIIKWRCISIICPLTPQLLGEWLDGAAGSTSRPAPRDLSSSCRLSLKAHVRLIAALDKNVPCWLQTNHTPPGIHGSLSEIDFQLARVVHEAGGHITVARAYRQLSRSGRPDDRRLTIETFLRGLNAVEHIVVEFTNPEMPIIRLRRSNIRVLVGEVSNQNGTPLIARKIHSGSTSDSDIWQEERHCRGRVVARR